MKQIAIVEDNASNMKLVTEILKRAGYQTITADNARKGMALIQQHMPDLVLMDMHMPGIDGMEATRILKSDSKTQQIPIVAVTARAMDGDRKLILGAGCDGYISKPIRYKELLSLIEQLLGDKS